MAERTVRVNLVAQVNGYISGMDQAARKTRELGSEADRLAQKRQAFEDLGRPLLAFGAIAAAAVGIAIKKFADFDQAMSQVNAVTQETAANLDLLKDAALEAGGATVFTATEAANAIEELGKAGLSTADILGGALGGALSLAASGQLGVARAAEITATTLKQFGLEGTDAARVADVLSAGAGKALGSVEDLAQALKFVGPVAGVMGISLEDVTATLSLFADQGIIGEQAGSALRGMLASLQAPSAAAKAKLDDLGITLYDLQTGAFLGLGPVVDQLNSKLGGVDDQTRDTALGLIFTNAQLTTAQTLVGEAGAKWGQYRAQVEDAGYAARVAADRMDNLTGDIEKLGGAFDTFLIKSGSSANDVLRTLIQTLTFVVDAAGELPEPVLAAGLAIGTLAAATGLLGGATLLAVPRVVAFKTALDTLKISASGATLAIGLIGGAIGVATFAISSFIARQADLAATGDALVDSLDKASGAFTNYSREIIANKLQESGAADTAKALGISLRTLTDAAFGLAPAMKEVDDAVAASIVSGETSTRGAENFKAGIADLRNEVQQAPKDFEELSSATDDNSEALGGLRGEAENAGDAISGLADIIRGFASATLSTRDAERQFQEAIDDATESVAANGATLDINSAEGRKNQETLDEIAKSAQELAAARLEETGSQEQATAAIQSGRDALIEQLAQYGIVGAEAEAYADSLGLIPSNISTAVSLDTTQARTDFGSFLRDLNGTTVAVNVAATRNFATGGYTGPGGKYEPAGVVHRGEFVSTAETVRDPANRAVLEYMQRGGSVRGYASGGYVSAQPSNVSTSTTSITQNITASDPLVAAQKAAQLTRASLMGVK